jgi:hypothetical protein
MKGRDLACEDVAQFTKGVGIATPLPQLLRQRDAALQVTQRAGRVACTVGRQAGGRAGR